MALWHVDKRLPDGFKWVPRGQRYLAWSKHAERARETDRHGIIPKTKTVDLTGTKIIEVETDDSTGKVSKVVFRKNHNRDLDIVYVCIPIPAKNVWFVKTVWFNRATDNHRTLDLSRYSD